LDDKISNSPKEINSLIFASGFDGGITDLKIGPDDGYLYILTISDSIYRIILVVYSCNYQLKLLLLLLIDGYL
jgi:hypothetical protein